MKVLTTTEGRRIAFCTGYLRTISPSARYIAPITAWLRYWAYGDENAKRFFSGPSCEMCSSPWITPEGNAKWQALSL